MNNTHTIIIQKWELLVLHAFIFILPTFCLFVTNHALSAGLVTVGTASFVTSIISYFSLATKSVVQ